MLFILVGYYEWRTLRTFLYSPLGDYLYLFLLATCLRVELLRHRLGVCSVSEDVANSFPGAVLIYTLANEFQVLHILTNICYYLILSIPVDLWWYHIMVLIFISLMFCVAA